MVYRIHDIIMDRRIRIGSIRFGPKLPRRMFLTQYEPYVLLLPIILHQFTDENGIRM